jgi:cold shock CspA family protein
MPTGRVKVYHQDGQFGFLTTEDGEEVYVHGGDVAGSSLRSGDEVTYELGEGDNGQRAVDVQVLSEAPADNPVGRTIHQPPTWSSLQERDRRRRQNRRRRR